MLALSDSTLILSATDLTNHLACPHLTQQRVVIARGERAKPRPADDPYAELIRRRGDAHERAQLERLRSQLGDGVDLSKLEPSWTLEDLTRAAAATERAMRDGAPLIYQASFSDGRWQGRVDFLRRVAGSTSLGSWAYEAIDTKLARQVKPHFVHQLTFYSRLLAGVQARMPAHAYVFLGDGSEVTLELRRYASRASWSAWLSSQSTQRIQSRSSIAPSAGSPTSARAASQRRSLEPRGEYPPRPARAHGGAWAVDGPGARRDRRAA